MKILGVTGFAAEFAGDAGIGRMDAQPFHEPSEPCPAETVSGTEAQVSNAQNLKSTFFKLSDPPVLAKSNEFRESITRDAVYPRQQQLGKKNASSSLWSKFWIVAGRLLSVRPTTSAGSEYPTGQDAVDKLSHFVGNVQ